MPESTLSNRRISGLQEGYRQMTDDNHDEDGISRRHALECMIWAGTGVLWTVIAGVPTSVGLLDRALAAGATTGLTFLQISDSHVGFDKPANPHALDTLREAIDRVEALPQKPSFMLHTGDITHLSKPAEFDNAAQRAWRARHRG
jgi:hypothetical protein